MFKYDQATHTLIQQPEMKEPEYQHGNAAYDIAAYNYRKHIASLKTYNVPSEFWDYWKDGEDLEEGKHFELREETEPYFGWCDVEGCENEGANGGGCWRETGYWTVCSKHSAEFRNGELQPKMKRSAIDREKTRGEDGVLTEPVPLKLITIPIVENKHKTMILECNHCGKNVSFPVLFCDDIKCPMREENKEVEEEKDDFEKFAEKSEKENIAWHDNFAAFEEEKESQNDDYETVVKISMGHSENDIVTGAPFYERAEKLRQKFSIFKK